jgi:hypothetical protein
MYLAIMNNTKVMMIKFITAARNGPQPSDTGPMILFKRRMIYKRVPAEHVIGDYHDLQMWNPNDKKWC